MNTFILTYLSICTISWLGRINTVVLSRGQHIESSHSKFKIITKNDDDNSNFSENDSTKYIIDDEQVNVRYKFINGSQCVGLKYDDTSVWSYDSTKDGENYPLEIFLNFLTSNVRIKTKNKLYIYSYRNDKWDLILESEVISDPKDYSQLTTHTTDTSESEWESLYFPVKRFNYEYPQVPCTSSGEFVDKLYDLQIQILTEYEFGYDKKKNDLKEFCVKPHGNFITYELLNFDVNCKLKYKNELLWQDKGSSIGIPYPKLIYIYLDKEVICFDFSGRSFLMLDRRRINKYVDFMKQVSTKTSVESTTPTTKTFYLKIKNNDEPSSTAHRELVVTHNNPGFLKYKFKEDEKCIEISCGLVIWNHDSAKHGDNYPTEVYFDFWAHRSIKIKFNSRSYLYAYSDDNWFLKTLSIDSSSNHTIYNESFGENFTESTPEVVNDSPVNSFEDSFTGETTTEPPADGSIYP